MEMTDMRHHGRALTAVLAIIASIVVGSAQQRRPQDIDLQAAIRTETVDGDLAKAVRQFEAIATKYKSDRATVATALVHLAACHQKLGDAESRRIYEQIARDFSDQKDAWSIAQARLGVLGGAGKTAAMNSRLVWSGPAVDAEGTVSPDGRYVSFTDWDTGNLAVRELATGAERRITDAPKGVSGWAEFAEESAISRDGKRVAYSWKVETNKRYELRVANLAGGNPSPMRVYDNPETDWIMPFDWAPDGRSVAVEISRIDRTTQLGVMSVPDGAPRILKSVDWGKAGRMFFSPDGRWLGYDLPESAANPQRHVSVLAVDGSRELHVDHHGQERMVGWSPDGKWLLFSSDRTGSTDLWAAPFAGSGSLGSPQLLKAGFDLATSLGVTASGTLYYAQSKGGGRSRIQIASLDIAAGKLSASHMELPQSPQDSYTSAAWSPDGKRLAYVSERGATDPKTSVLMIRSNDTGQVRELRPNLNYLLLLNWAPGGHSLLASGRDFKNRAGVFVVDVETGDVKAVGPEAKNVYLGAWAPDGRSFLMETSAGLYRIDPATGSTSEILPMPPTQGGWGLYAHWAPDGKRIYYQHVFKAKDGAIEDCSTVEHDLASNRERELVRRPGFVCIPKPTPDGRHILATNADPATNSRTLRLIPVDGGQPRDLMRVPSGVKPDDLNNINLGQALIVATVGASDPTLVVKRVGDRHGFILNGHDPSELWLVPLTAGEPKKIGHTPPGVTTMSVSPDQRQIAYTVTDAGFRQPATELWALENFLPKATARK